MRIYKCDLCGEQETNDSHLMQFNTRLLNCSWDEKKENIIELCRNCTNRVNCLREEVVLLHRNKFNELFKELKEEDEK